MLVKQDYRKRSQFQTLEQFSQAFEDFPKKKNGEHFQLIWNFLKDIFYGLQKILVKKKNIFSPWAQFRPRTKYYSIWFWTFQKQFCKWRVLELNFCMHIDVAETRPQEKKWELIPRPEIIFTSFQWNFSKNR